MTIRIYEKVATEVELTALLEQIALLIEDGFTSGKKPSWEIIG